VAVLGSKCQRFFLNDLFNRLPEWIDMAWILTFAKLIGNIKAKQKIIQREYVKPSNYYTRRFQVANYYKGILLTASTNRGDAK